MAEPATDDQGNPNPVSAKLWHDRLSDYRRLIEDNWETQRKNLDKLYSKEERADNEDREYSIFWANIEVLRGAVYARAPVPVVAPRFKQKNKVASVASEVLERSLITSFEQDDIDGCMQEVRDELLRYSRGTAWARLDVRNGAEIIVYDHVTASDFAHDPARTWREVRWVAKRSWLSREKGRARFDSPPDAPPEEQSYLAKYGKTFDDIQVQKKDPNAPISKESAEEQVPVWECWDKDANLVVWINEETECPLDVKPPWLQLSSFWPCPKPAFGTLVPGKLRPVPDIVQYKDQIEEINEYTARISALAESLRVKGFYPAGLGEISEAIEVAVKSTDNRRLLVPVSSAAAFGNGSFKDSIVWLPLDQVAAVIKQLVELRRVLIDDVYQITGISDILRGDTESSETATAQQIKSQWGSVRIRNKQDALAGFACDLTRIGGEIMAENFQPQTLAAMSQIDLPTADMKQQAAQQVKLAQTQAQQAGQQAPPVPPEVDAMLKKPTFEEVVEFLRDDRTRGFTIEIETDSTIAPDENAEKQRRAEFIAAVGGFIKEALPAMQAAPQMGPFLGEALKFVAAGFRAGRALEDEIEQLVDQMKAAAAQPQQPQPDPKAEAEKARAEADMQRTQMKSEQDQAKHGMTMERINSESVLGQQKMQADMAMGQQEIAMGQQELAQDWQRHQMRLREQAMAQQMPQVIPMTRRPG